MEDKTCIVACEALKLELDLVIQNRNCSLPVYWIDQGKHSRPDDLRAAVQEALDQLTPGHRVLLLFGFCGNAMVGLNAGTHTLVLPKVADCIPLYIGSRQERDSYGTAVYFFTEGYMNSKTGGIASDSNRTLERYGEKRGTSILKKMLGHYKNFAVIDTGAFDVAPVQEKVEKFAKIVDIPVITIPGSVKYIDALLSSEWPESDFLIVQPGGNVRFEDSLGLGQSQDQNTA